MASLLISTLTISLVGSLVYYLLHLSRTSSKLPPPPGPKPWPVIGNITDLPPQTIPDYQHWINHKDKYPISSLNLAGQTMVILHDREAVTELLEKRSKVASSRPVMHFANLCGYGKFVTSQPYNDTVRKHRKLIHQQLGTKKIMEQYRDIQREEVAHMLLHIQKKPEEAREHFKTLAGAVILNISYGYSVETKGPDPLVEIIDRMMANFSLAFVPLAWLVDGLPVLKYLPEWLPGMAFKKTAKEWSRIVHMTVDIPYAFTRQQMATSGNKPSLVSRLVADCTNHDASSSLSSEDEDAIKWVAAVLYAGGADTTVSSLSSFLLAMVKFPEVQRKAQSEIDKVIGQSRLPQYEDRDNLPYVEGIIKETLRWHPVAPLGVPHTFDEDITYKGYLMPKGTIVIPSVWWFLHDPEVYEDPDSFEPERYLSPRHEPEPNTAAFGFGRRLCPGRFVADTTLYLGIAQILAVFNIEKALDKNGVPIDPEKASTSGLLDHPHEFAFRITPRSAAHRELLKDAEKEFPWQQGDAEKLGDAKFVADILTTAHAKS